MDDSDLAACGSELLQQVAATLNHKKGADGPPEQCLLCGNWITSARNIRAHVATHLAIKRLICKSCGQGFDRMNRASIHVKRCHAEDPNAKVVSVLNAEHRREIEMLARKCFPRRNFTSSSKQTK